MQNDIPKHIAIIMDGNGRWAEAKGQPRIKGHEIGAKRVEEITEAAAKRGVSYLTLYAFSKENWKRPQNEIDFLMQLLSFHLESKIDAMLKDNIIFNVIGEISDLPEMLQKKIKQVMERTKKNTGLTLTFALSYSSRFEITRACRLISEKIKKGELNPEDLSENTISENLYTVGMPDPDLLIRTSGEMRISNFLLWQISYSELYVTDKLWPEFTEYEFGKAIEEYGKRERRFGATKAIKSEG